MKKAVRVSNFAVRRLAVGLAGYCAFINLYSPQAILPLLSVEYGAGAAEISTIMAAGTLAVALTAPFTGTVADVLGRKRVIVATEMRLVPVTIGAMQRLMERRHFLKAAGAVGKRVKEMASDQARRAVQTLADNRQKLTDDLSSLEQDMRSAARELDAGQHAASDKLRSALGRNGVDYVRQQYRWDIVLGKYERLFATIRNAR